MNDYFWAKQPVIGLFHDPQMIGKTYYAMGLRSDGQMFYGSIAMTDAYLVRNDEEQRFVLSETMRQLAYQMETFLDPACICRVGQTEVCPVRHPPKLEGANDATI